MPNLAPSFWTTALRHNLPSSVSRDTENSSEGNISVRNWPRSGLSRPESEGNISVRNWPRSGLSRPESEGNISVRNLPRSGPSRPERQEICAKSAHKFDLAGVPRPTRALIFGCPTLLSRGTGKAASASWRTSLDRCNFFSQKQPPNGDSLSLPRHPDPCTPLAAHLPVRVHVPWATPPVATREPQLQRTKQFFTG
eukprot:jgi/Botrbrau1/23264/Bobra.0102s0009.1